MTSNEVSAVSAAVTSVDGRVNTVSNLVSALTSAHNTVSVIVNAVSARTTAAVSVQGLQSAVNALSSRISALTGGAGSVTSTELSAVSAAAYSAALAGGGMWNYVTANLSVSTTGAGTYSNIPGLSIAVSTGVVYRCEAFVALRFGTSTAVNQGKITYPAMTMICGKSELVFQPPIGLSDTYTAITARMGIVDSGLSHLFSTPAASLNVSTFSPWNVNFICNPSANGSIHLQLAVSAGTATTVFAGSYIKVWRIV